VGICLRFLLREEGSGFACGRFTLASLLGETPEDEIAEDGRFMVVVFGATREEDGGGVWSNAL